MSDRHPNSSSLGPEQALWLSGEWPREGDELGVDDRDALFFSHAGVTAVADVLGRAKSTVSDRLSKLAGQGFLRRDGYGGYDLTPRARHFLASVDLPTGGVYRAPARLNNVQVTAQLLEPEHRQRLLAGHPALGIVPFSRKTREKETYYGTVACDGLRAAVQVHGDTLDMQMRGHIVAAPGVGLFRAECWIRVIHARLEEAGVPTALPTWTVKPEFAFPGMPFAREARAALGGGSAAIFPEEPGLAFFDESIPRLGVEPETTCLGYANRLSSCLIPKRVDDPADWFRRMALPFRGCEATHGGCITAGSPVGHQSARDAAH